MIIDKIKNLVKIDQVDHQTQADFFTFINYLDENFEKCKSKLTEVKNKYNFFNIHNYFPGAVGDVHLEFVTGAGIDTSTIVCLNNCGNVDSDDELGVLIEEVPFALLQKTWEENYDTLERLYYTWLAFAWQEIKGYETELKVRIIDAGASQEFSLNDYAWWEMSDYFEWNETPQQVENPFKRNLEFEEIFHRTRLPKNKRELQNGHEGVFVKDDNVKLLMLINDTIVEKEEKNNEIDVTESEKKETNYETARSFSRRTINLINDNWTQKIGNKIIK